jgi:uncharacterized protein
MFPKTDKTSASRYASQRLHYSEETVYPILDEALFCTVSYSVNDEPFAIPTAFVREGNQLYIHGSVGSHFLRGLTEGKSVCISIMLTDDLVIAKSAFDHSVNYRSVIIFSKAIPVDDYEIKANFFKKLTEKMVPGSWDYLRPMKATEVNKTMLISFIIEEASAKVRQGMPSFDDAEKDLPIWSGLIPIPSKRLTPIADETSQHIPLPDHLRIT